MCANLNDTALVLPVLNVLKHYEKNTYALPGLT